MPIDSSIIARLQPPATIQAPDPLENYARIMGVQNAMRQGQLGQLQLTAAEKAAKDDQDYSDAFKASGGNLEKLLPELANRGLGKQSLDVQSKILGNRKTESEIGKNNADTGLNQQKILGEAVSRGRDQLATVNDPQAAAAWTAAQFNNPVTGQLFKDSGISLEQKLAEIPTDPAKFQEWKINHILGAEKLVTHLDEMSKLKETGRHNVAEEANGRMSAGAAASQAGTAAARLRYDQLNPPQTFDAERGINVNTRTNVASPVLQSGAPIGPKVKDLTESQGKAAAFAGRAQAADAIINSVGNAGAVQPSMIKRGADAIPTVMGGPAYSMLANKLAASPDQQKVEQAQRDFVNAVLRLESGASISPSEFESAKIQYFPQPGDSPQLIAQKAQSRAIEIDGLKQMAGPNAKISKQPSPIYTGKIGGILTPNADGSFNYGAH